MAEQALGRPQVDLEPAWPLKEKIECENQKRMEASRAIPVQKGAFTKLMMPVKFIGFILKQIFIDEDPVIGWWALAIAIVGLFSCHMVFSLPEHPTKLCHSEAGGYLFEPTLKWWLHYLATQVFAMAVYHFISTTRRRHTDKEIYSQRTCAFNLADWLAPTVITTVITIILNIVLQAAAASWPCCQH